jgi:hypothetical protein
MNDLATPQAAPGTVLPYNLITDVGGAVNPNEITNVILLQPAPIEPLNDAAIFFTTTNAYDETQTNNGAMVFNQLGLMAGPSHLPPANGGGVNTGGVVTLTLWQSLAGLNPEFSIIAQTTVDLTNATPGQFVWSAPLSTSFNIYSSMGANRFNYNITVTVPSQYLLYIKRPITVRQGNTWGSARSSSGFSNPNNDHLCAYGGVDLNNTRYPDLGTASLSPNVSFSGTLKREGSFGTVSLSPRIGLTGRPQRAGVFEGDNDMAPSIVLNATSMAGGPLWKPSKLCTG